jgi:hypothetical protein
MPGSLYATSKDQSFVLDWLLPVACEEPSILSLSLSVCMRACVRALIILLLNFYVLLRCFYMSFWYLFSLVHRVFSHLENQAWSIIQKAFYFVRKNESKKHFCIHWSPEFCLSKQILYALDHCLFFACASGLRELTCILLAN